MTPVEELEAYALAHYDEGGHWVYETYDTENYQEVLNECKGDMDAAKICLRSSWELTVMMERNAAWGGPDESPC